ncbi:MAG: hypothetical protein AAF768_10375 [Pseudomonadota bacterium]
MPHTIATSDGTADAALEVAPTTFKLNLPEGDLKTGWSDLPRAGPIIEIDIAKADIGRLVVDRTPTSTNGLSPKLLFFARGLAEPVETITTAIAMLVSRVAVMTAGFEVETAIAGMNGNRGAAEFAVPFVSKGRSGEEQRRRKNKRGCSGGHDTLYHEDKKSQVDATRHEHYV